MRIRTLLVPALLLLFLVTPQASFAEGAVEKLKADVVTKRDGKFFIEEFELCSFPGTKRLQVRYHSEAPADGSISRDNFVSYSTMYALLSVLALAESTPGRGLRSMLDSIDCKAIPAPIGKIDLEINTYMTPEGIQLEVVDARNNKRERSTQTWEEILSD